ncbi:MAG: hypothetical protein N4A43_01670 [Alphaproteobacteria bacterium]|nr:hypothetical protein [Alphaproteobacteria bacterium]
MNNIIINHNWLSSEDLAKRYNIKVFDALDVIDKLKKQKDNLEYIKVGRKKKTDFVNKTFISPEEDFLKKVKKELQIIHKKRIAISQKIKITKQKSLSKKEIERRKKYKNLVPEDSLSANDLEKITKIRANTIRKILKELYKLKGSWGSKTFPFPIVKGLKLRTSGCKGLYILADKKSKNWAYKQLGANIKSYIDDSFLSYKDISEKTGLDTELIKNFLRNSFENKENLDKYFKNSIVKGRKKHHSSTQIYLDSSEEALNWLKKEVIEKNQLDFINEWLDVSHLQRRLNYFKIDIRKELREMYKTSKLLFNGKSSDIVFSKYNKETKRKDYFLKNSADNFLLLKRRLRKRYGNERFIPYRWKSCTTLNHYINLSTSKIREEMKRLYESKSDNSDYLPLRFGFKFNSAVKTYYLDSSEEALNWFKQEIKVKRPSIEEAKKTKIVPILNTKKVISESLVI